MKAAPPPCLVAPPGVSEVSQKRPEGRRWRWEGWRGREFGGGKAATRLPALRILEEERCLTPGGVLRPPRRLAHLPCVSRSRRSLKVEVELVPREMRPKGSDGSLRRGRGESRTPRPGEERVGTMLMASAAHGACGGRGAAALREEEG